MFECLECGYTFGINQWDFICCTKESDARLLRNVFTPVCTNCFNTIDACRYIEPTDVAVRDR